jgi:hypothetical protein
LVQGFLNFIFNPGTSLLQLHLYLNVSKMLINTSTSPLLILSTIETILIARKSSPQKQSKCRLDLYGPGSHMQNVVSRGLGRGGAISDCYVPVLRVLAFTGQGTGS